MAVPKRRTSKARRDKRRSNVWKLTYPNLSKCKNCGEFILPHHICNSCGHYKGIKILEISKSNQG